jgi:hypothetical protein
MEYFEGRKKGNASQEVLLLRGWLKILARAKYRFADG